MKKDSRIKDALIIAGVAVGVTAGCILFKRGMTYLLYKKFGYLGVKYMNDELEGIEIG